MKIVALEQKICNLGKKVMPNLAYLVMAAIFTACGSGNISGNSKITLDISPWGGKVAIELIGRGTVFIDWGDGSKTEKHQLTDESNSYSFEFPNRLPNFNSRTITITGKNITGLSVSGDAPFRLNCSNNQLTSLDVSGANKLTELNCSENQFTADALNALFGTLHNDTYYNVSIRETPFASAYQSREPKKTTIDITGNLGSDACHRSIATDKGWSFETSGGDYKKEPETLPARAKGNSIERAKGNSIEIDLSTFYSLEISPEELIADLKKADIKTVNYLVINYWDGSVDDNLLRKEYMQALEENGIGIWLMLLGKGFYENTTLPASWEQTTIVQHYPGYRNYSFHNDDYVNWHVERVKRVITNYPNFIGIEFAETFFPAWKSIDGNGYYGDVSPFAREKFTKEYLKLDRETLSFAEIRRNAEWYKKWQDFRVDAIVKFNQKMKDAIKSTNPEVLFAAWGMGIRNGTLEEIREHWGLDMVRIVQEVEPDIFYVQTSSEDWLDVNLQPQYIDGYSYIVEALQKANPNVMLGVQTDIASHSWNNPNAPRDGVWWKTFMELSLSIGYYTNTAFDYGFYKQQGLWIEINE